MMKKCVYCGEFHTELTKLCTSCLNLYKAQVANGIRVMNVPISECVIDGCENNATGNGFCEEHSMLLVKQTNRRCLHSRCRNNGAINGVCVAHYIKQVDELTPLPRTRAELLDRKTSKNRIAETFKHICKPDHVYLDDNEPSVIENPLADFLQNHPAFSTNSFPRCNSTYGCTEPVYKEGLCRAHYRMKYSLKTTEPLEDNGYLQPSDNGKRIRINDVKPLKEVTTCLTDGCKMPGLVAGYCYKCSKIRTRSIAEKLRARKTNSNK